MYCLGVNNKKCENVFNFFFLIDFVVPIIKMVYYQRKGGKFCSKKSGERYANVSNAATMKWQNYNHEEIVESVHHDHDYLHVGSSTCDENIDVCEEEVGATTLPKSVIPIDKYRLVVELGHIVKQLIQGCVKCRLPLNICSAQGVTTRGLGGWIYITCDNPACKIVNRIALGKQHKKTLPHEDNPFDIMPPGNAIFDVNTKAASGIIHAGMGESDLNNLLSTLNLPTISHKSLKKREIEIGSVMQKYANTSADAALIKEQELTQKDLKITESVGIEISSDVAWQKWGSQRSYNSLSGIASAIGRKTRKIVHFNSCYKRCRICWYATKHNRSP